MTTTTNIDGTNPGPASDLSDFPQSSIGNIQKVGLFQISLTPSSVAANTTAEQTFAATGIGLSTGGGFTTLQPQDFVWVNKPTAQAGLAIGGVRVSATDTLAITYVNDTGSPITPTAETYLVLVTRRQSNWAPPATGNQLDY